MLLMFEQEALVFIHGYHVTFDEAARKTAQLNWDLGFRGIPIPSTAIHGYNSNVFGGRGFGFMGSPSPRAVLKSGRAQIGCENYPHSCA
jgi:hypothetical protein